MTDSHFKALVIEEAQKVFTRKITQRSIDDLPSGDLLVRVKYSSLNYKDALSAIGNRGVTRSYPHTPGIDAAGIVEQSQNPSFTKGQEVIVTSYDLGMNTDGGFGQFVRVPSQWAIKLPQGLSLKESMIIGTAGLTAGMSVLRLTEKVNPDQGQVIVSGATGGVGSMSVALLSKLGYEVAALTGKPNEENFLTRLGARHLISREEFQNPEKAPLLKALFSGGIDTVGGPILDNIIKSTLPTGVVTCCGNVASPKLDLTVFPFILRGLSLVGIDSQNYPMEEREKVWKNLATDWKPDHLLDMFTQISLEELSQSIDQILEGKLKGRTVINMEDC